MTTTTALRIAYGDEGLDGMPSEPCALCASPLGRWIAGLREAGNPDTSGESYICDHCAQQYAPGYAVAATRFGLAIDHGDEDAALSAFIEVRATIAPLLAALGHPVDRIETAITATDSFIMCARPTSCRRVGAWPDGTPYEFHFMADDAPPDGPAA